MPKLNSRDSTAASVRAAAGLLLARAAGGRSATLIDRLGSLSADQKQQLDNNARSAVKSLDLPKSVLENNWTVDPYGLQRLAARMRVKITQGKVDDLIPIYPRDPDAFKRYIGIFNRAARELMGYKGFQFGEFVAAYAIPWMKGEPYPALLSRWVAYQKKTKPEAKINDLVRKAFDFIEDTLRFQMVQIGKAYLDLLHAVFDEVGLSGRRTKISTMP